MDLFFRIPPPRSLPLHISLKKSKNVHNMPSFTVQLGQLYPAYTLKKDLPFPFFVTYQAFKSREGLFFENSY